MKAQNSSKYTVAIMEGSDYLCASVYCTICTYMYLFEVIYNCLYHMHSIDHQCIINALIYTLLAQAYIIFMECTLYYELIY